MRKKLNLPHIINKNKFQFDFFNLNMKNITFRRNTVRYFIDLSVRFLKQDTKNTNCKQIYNSDDIKIMMMVTVIIINSEHQQTLQCNFSGSPGVNNLPCNAGDLGLIPSWGTNWKRKWQRTPVLLPGKFHGLRSLVGYSPWGRRESDTTERLHSLYNHKTLAGFCNK